LFALRNPYYLALILGLLANFLISDNSGVSFISRKWLIMQPAASAELKKSRAANEQADPAYFRWLF
jgi:hypothetical protein